MNDPSKPPGKKRCYACQSPIDERYLFFTAGKWFCGYGCAWDYVPPAAEGDVFLEDLLEDTGVS